MRTGCLRIAERVRTESSRLFQFPKVKLKGHHHAHFNKGDNKFLDLIKAVYIYILQMQCNIMYWYLCNDLWDCDSIYKITVSVLCQLISYSRDSQPLSDFDIKKAPPGG